jgi:hypothetical protein
MSNNSKHFTHGDEIKDEMYAHLQQLYPQQMLVGGDEKLELLEI